MPSAFLGFLECGLNVSGGSGLHVLLSLASSVFAPPKFVLFTLYISKRSIHFTQVQRSMRAQGDSRFSTMMMMIMMRRASSVHALPGQCSP